MIVDNSVKTDQILDEPKIKIYINLYRYYGIFSIVIATLFPLTSLLLPFSLATPFFEFLEWIFLYSLISFLPAIVSSIGFLRNKFSHAISRVDQVNKVVEHVSDLWLIGLVSWIFVAFVTQLGHVDCGYNCAISVFISDLLSIIYFIAWVAFPFAFRKYGLRMLKNKSELPLKK